MKPVPELLRHKSLLSGRDVSEFLTAGPIYVFDPDTLVLVAEVAYGQDGRVRMTTTEGRSDSGIWGINGDKYWTQYSRFRDGSRHEFFLEAISPDTVQAHFDNGTQAFLQSHRPRLVSDR